MIRLFLLFTLFSVCVPTRSLAGVEQISEKDFRELAIELSHKVPLFRDAWKQDPSAEFYGGTSRDYLYWLKGQFREAHNKAEADHVIKELKSLALIDQRGFIIGESDVDIVTEKAIPLQAETYGMRKIDFQSARVFDPATTSGFDDRHQGYIPAEKIRLGSSSILTNAPDADGLNEIYHGKLSIHFASPEDFALTTYARSKENHPILLAARYLRLQAINYFRNFGGGYPDPQKLLDGTRPDDVAAVKRLIAEAAENDSLREYLAQPRFRTWLNGSIQKAFRSYTNPTAALELFREFGMDDLVKTYSPELEPINQYVFAKYRDEKAIQAFLQKHNSSPAALYQSPEEFFPDGFLYHGTSTEAAFRGILLQGFLPSNGGNAGHGLYGVAEKNKSFSESWAGSRDRLIRLPVLSYGKIVDIEKGEGLRLWNEIGTKNYEEFAEVVGADILKYPYTPEAYVVKNSAVLGRPEGVYRKVLTISDLLRIAKKDPSQARKLFADSVSQFTAEELPLIIDAIKPDAVMLTDLLASKTGRGLDNAAIIKLLKKSELNAGQLLRILLYRDLNAEQRLGHKEMNELSALIARGKIADSDLSPLIAQARDTERWRTLHAIIENTLDQPAWKDHPEIIDTLLTQSSLTDEFVYLNDALKNWRSHPRHKEWEGKLAALLPNKKTIVARLTDKATKNMPPELAVQLLKFAEPTPLEILKVAYEREQILDSRFPRKLTEPLAPFIRSGTVSIEDFVAFFKTIKVENDGRELRYLLRYGLSHPGWEKYPEIIDYLIAGSEESAYLGDLGYLFENDAWVKSPNMINWLEQLSKKPNSGWWLSRLLLNTLSKLPETPRKKALIDTYLARESTETDASMLETVFIKGTTSRENLQNILDRAAGAKDPAEQYKYFLQGPMTQEQWSKEISWVQTIVDFNNKKDNFTLDEAVPEFFSKNYFPGHAEFLRPLIKISTSSRGHKFLDPAFKLWEQDPEIKAYLHGKALDQESLGKFLEARPVMAVPVPTGCGPSFAALKH